MLRTGWPRNLEMIPVERCFCSPKRSDGFWGQHNPFLMDTGGSFPRSGRGWYMRLTTHHHLVSSLRRRGDIHPIARRYGFTESSSIVHKNTYTFTTLIT